MTRAAPSSVSTRHQEVTRLLQSGDLKSAAALSNRLTSEFPEYYPGWHTASFIALCLGQVDSAMQMIQRALADCGSDPRYLLQYARCLSAQRRVAESVAAAVAAQRSAVKDPQ